MYMYIIYISGPQKAFLRWGGRKKKSATMVGRQRKIGQNTLKQFPKKRKSHILNSFI